MICRELDDAVKKLQSQVVLWLRFFSLSLRRIAIRFPPQFQTNNNHLSALLIACPSRTKSPVRLNHFVLKRTLRNWTPELPQE